MFKIIDRVPSNKDYAAFRKIAVWGDSVTGKQHVPKHYTRFELLGMNEKHKGRTLKYLLIMSRPDNALRTGTGVMSKWHYFGHWKCIAYNRGCNACSSLAPGRAPAGNCSYNAFVSSSRWRRSLRLPCNGHSSFHTCPCSAGHRLPSEQERRRKYHVNQMTQRLRLVGNKRRRRLLRER